MAVLLAIAATPEGGPFRVGGDVKAPVLLHHVEPIWTSSALKSRVSGIVIVEAIVDKSGRVTDAHILKPLPLGLDQAALDAVKQWQFRPGTLNGRPVPVIFTLPVSFTQPSDFAPAELTARDAAVISAALDAVDREPDLIINNEAPAAKAIIAADSPAAHDFDARNGQPHLLRSLHLRRSFELVEAWSLRNAWDRNVSLTLPGYSADGRTAVEMIAVEWRASDNRSRLRYEWAVLQKVNGRWKVSQKRSDRKW